RLLIRVLDQVFRMRDADVLSAPARSPDHVEDPVRPLNNAGIAHQLLTADHRRQIRLVFVQRVPFQTVVTVGQMQPVLAVVFEISEQIIRAPRSRLLRDDRGRENEQRQDDGESGKYSTYADEIMVCKKVSDCLCAGGATDISRWWNHRESRRHNSASPGDLAKWHTGRGSLKFCGF